MMKWEYKYRAVGALLLLLILPAAAKNPLNFRMRKKPAISTTSASGFDSSQTEPKIPTYAHLMSGRWSPQVRARIEALMNSAGRESRNYNAQKPPVAVIPWSDASVLGDPAELVFLHFTSEAKFHVDDKWWEMIPVGYGRQSTRAAYEQFITLSSITWTQQPSYHAWRKGLLSSYLSLCRSVGRKECRSYLSRLMSGWSQEGVEDFARSALREEKRHLGTVELILGEPGDRFPIRARRGLRIIPEIRDLVGKLRAAGFDVWVVDDIAQPILSVSAADYGVDPTRAYGIHNSTDGARMNGDILKPVPTRGGKAEIIQMSLGRPPDLVLGRDVADIELLSYGTGLRVVFDTETELVTFARQRGWLIQAAFTR